MDRQTSCIKAVSKGCVQAVNNKTNISLALLRRKNPIIKIPLALVKENATASLRKTMTLSRGDDQNKKHKGSSQD
ncbi:MAG: hypothetical protein JKX92_07475 [Porticoccaceae bacterium]|nr:hypothetical protein [Porticoccaceae bacterium]